MWHPLTAADALPPGTSREFTIGDRVLAVFNVDGLFHALDGICPHAGGPLAEGTLRGDVVTCPWHGWQFRVSSGQHCLSTQIRQTCYPVRIEAGQLQVDLP